MIIWHQTSLFAYSKDQTLENIVPSLKLFGEPTSYMLVKKFLGKYTAIGDVVLDPCCGNGTTGIAALELNRKSILCDLNPFAVKTTKTLFNFFDYNRVMALWQNIRDCSQSQIHEEGKKKWDSFITNPIPQFPSFKRIINNKVEQVAEIYHPEDLQDLQELYTRISGLKDLTSRELLEVVFYSTLLESSQLAVSRNRRSYYLPKHRKQKYPIQIYQNKLDHYLQSKSLIRDQRARNFAWTPKVHLSSAFDLQTVETSSVDYILLHLPGIRGYSEGEMSYLIEILLGQYTNRTEEMTIDLDYRGRYRLNRDFTRLFKEMERVLKDGTYFTLIFTGHHVLLTLIVQLAGKEGWQLIPEEVEMVANYANPDYPTLCLTLQKRSQHTILGALNKMKCETLYDTEEAILRKIDQYLSEYGTASLEEIQRYLIANYLHDCLIERSLEDILHENFMFSGKYWVKPSPEQKEELFKKRRAAMRKNYPEFVREMTYCFLADEHKGLSYEELVNRFSRLKPRNIFHTPYYRLLIEECEHAEIPLHKLVMDYLDNEKNDQFETLPDVLRKLIRSDSTFVELVPGTLVGLANWSADVFFKLYLELFEKTRRNKKKGDSEQYASKCLEILNQVTYLDELKKGKIREYLMRSEL